MSKSEPDPQNTNAPPDETADLARSLVEDVRAPRSGSKDDLGPGPGGRLPLLDLPGFGEAYPDCGDDRPHFCEHCGEPINVGRTCRRSVCPRCAPAWAIGLAGTGTGGTPGHVARLDATARMMSSERGGASMKWHHLIASPPTDWFLSADDPLERTVDTLRDMLDDLDARGFIYYHPWRGSDEEKDDIGEWKNRLFNQRDWEGDVRDELEPSPHFHLIVASEWIPGAGVTDVLHDETGWVLHRVADPETGVSIQDDLESLARVMTYCLSHTGIRINEDGNNRAAMWSHRARPDWCPRADESDAATRKVAPTTLGISGERIRCRQQVPADEANEDATPDPADVLEDGDGDGDPDVETTADPETVDMRECSGALREIDQAPDFLDDPKWRARARHAEELRQRWIRWEGSG